MTALLRSNGVGLTFRFEVDRFGRESRSVDYFFHDVRLTGAGALPIIGPDLPVAERRRRADAS